MKDKKFKRIYIEITNICNLECSFCPKTSRNKKFMSVENFKTILDEVSPYTDHIYLHVKGEPLMHPKIDDILDICSSYDLKINLTTNGTLLFKNKELLADKSSLRQINVSLHSFSDEADLSEVYEAIRYINENSKVFISLRLWNMDKASIFHRVFLSNRVFLSTDKEFEWPSLNREIISTSGRCHALTQQIGILVDGTIVPCCLDNEGDVKLGNIFSQSFKDILESEKFLSIRKGFMENKLKEELCKRCGYAQRFNKQKT